jgi:type IV secretion system protein VirB1
MIYDVPTVAALAQSCAPEIALEALMPLIQVESARDPLRINVNHGPRVAARSAADGAGIVRRFTSAGYTVDVGLAQINSGNFKRLGLTFETAFDPCTNLKAASQVLQEGYARASQRYSGMAAISATYSLYNSGSLVRGFTNGYVGRIWHAADNLLPRSALQTAAIEPAPSPALPDQPTEPAATSAPLASTRPPAQPDWVYGSVQAGTVVFK